MNLARVPKAALYSHGEGSGNELLPVSVLSWCFPMLASLSLCETSSLSPASHRRFSVPRAHAPKGFHNHPGFGACPLGYRHFFLSFVRTQEGKATSFYPRSLRKGAHERQLKKGRALLRPSNARLLSAVGDDTSASQVRALRGRHMVQCSRVDVDQICS